MALEPQPFGHLFVPAIAAFLTCFAIGIALCAVMGIQMRIAVPAGIVVAAAAAFYAALSHTRSRKP